MKVETVFLSINARNFAAQTAWWSTFLGREHDRTPMPSCHEWDLSPGVLFQVLDNENGPHCEISLRLDGLNGELERLFKAGIEVPEPQPVEGFDSLVWSAFKDPEGNPVNLLSGQ